MTKIWIVLAAVSACLVTLGVAVLAQTADPPYTVRVPVDEVSVTFRVAAETPELALHDVSVFDNGKRQRHVVAFERSSALAVRAGILFDTSRSVSEYRYANQQIAALYARRFLVKGTDRAFVTRFDSETRVMQGWTDDSDALVAALQKVDVESDSRLGGTALFDAVYKACRDEFGGEQRTLTGNFLLLFTDGLDNASHARAEDAVAECQQRRTAIYVFSGDAKSRFAEGQKVLSKLTQETGGRIFFAHTAAVIDADVRLMAGEQRTAYRLVYKPPHLRHDGAFHRLRVEAPVAEGTIAAPSGYYAAQ